MDTAPIKKQPEKILNAANFSGELMFLLKWKGIEELDVIGYKEAYSMCPQIVIKFYEEIITWRSRSPPYCFPTTTEKI